MKALQETTLVTGGAGFIGRHLCRALLTQGDEVIIVDNLLTGRLSSDLYGAERGVRAIVADITQPNFEAIVPELGGVTRIVHLACPAAPRAYQADPLATYRTAALGTHRILELASHLGARVVLASSSEVYGDPLSNPQTERDRARVSIIGPRACYDIGKAAAEVEALCMSAQGDIDVRIARIFNTYGPGMAIGDGRLVPSLVEAALSGRPLPIFGRGTQTRSLCYVADTAAALIRLLEVPELPDGPVVNVGNPQERTVLEIACAVESAVLRCGFAYQIGPRAFYGLPPDDPPIRCPSIHKATLTLGWKPKTSLSDGLDATVADFADRLDVKPSVRRSAP